MTANGCPFRALPSETCELIRSVMDPITALRFRATCKHVRNRLSDVDQRASLVRRAFCDVVGCGRLDWFLYQQGALCYGYATLCRDIYVAGRIKEYPPPQVCMGKRWNVYMAFPNREPESATVPLQLDPERRLIAVDVGWNMVPRATHGDQDGLCYYIHLHLNTKGPRIAVTIAIHEIFDLDGREILLTQLTAACEAAAGLLSWDYHCHGLSSSADTKPVWKRVFSRPIPRANDRERAGGE